MPKHDHEHDDGNEQHDSYRHQIVHMETFRSGGVPATPSVGMTMGPLEWEGRGEGSTALRQPESGL